MKINDIYDLIDKFEKSSLISLDLEQGDTKISVKKEEKRIISRKELMPINNNEIETENLVQDEKVYIKAPLVGTFYAAASPEGEPFVKQGDEVKKGETIGIIEAMKMINELPAPFDCVIKEVLVKNEDFISFDTPMFEIEEK